MENKIGLKKYLCVTFLISALAIILFVCINEYEAYIYRKNTNEKIGAIISSVINKYPEVTEDEISQRMSYPFLRMKCIKQLLC